jgi:hypothetical protein
MISTLTYSAASVIAPTLVSCQALPGASEFSQAKRHQSGRHHCGCGTEPAPADHANQDQ